MAYRTQKPQRIPFRVRLIFRDGTVRVADHRTLDEAKATAEAETIYWDVLEAEIENDGNDQSIVYIEGKAFVEGEAE